MWNGKNKALTFSYDDGVQEDKRLVELFNRYGLKGTFNLNSALLSEELGWNEWKRGLRVTHVNAAEVPTLYRGHEVAVHTAHHEDLTALPPDTLRKELQEDKAALEALIGGDVVGMAYPYGTHNEGVVAAVAAAGLCYARTVADTHRFDLPLTPLTWGHTCHHNDDRLSELAEAFLALETDTPQLFTVWGHSYEFSVDENWERIERFCERMAGRDDIAYVTNREALGL
ncbi:MAG: polysaccharide deacetylase family protein [Clostridia bacterium]|nr:polysaccharide deacetylase family protein [Clostridia bacterium]